MFGYNSIKEARTALKLSQKETADILGVSWRAVQRWDRGKVSLNPVLEENYIKILVEHERQAQIIFDNGQASLIFTDKDGTLLKRDFEMSEFSYANSLIKYLQENGYILFLEIK